MNSKIPKLPKRISIVDRISSITNAYVNGIIPLIEPTEEQVRDALRVLGMTEETIECAYCGDPCTEWDHLNPLVENKKPTGYITEIHNLMPSCATRNQSKGNQNWRKWIYSDAPKSPHSRGIKDLDERVARIDAYVSKFNPVRLNFEDIVGHCKWESYQQSLLELEEHMRQCQNLQDEVATQITEAYERSAVDRTSSNNDDEPSSVLSEQSCDSKKVSDLVRERLVPHLVAGDLNQESIAKLEDKAFSKETFGLNFSLLKRIPTGANASSEALDEHNNHRYYVHPIEIEGVRFLVCSQWYKQNGKRLERWLSNKGW